MKNINVSIMGWYGNANAGDEAVLAGILEHIRSLPINSSINVFSDNPLETTKLHHVNGLWTLTPSLISSLKSPLLWNFRHAFLPAMKVLKNTDLCIIGGGGIIADHNPKLIDTWCGRIRLALKYCKKTCLYGVGVEPLEHERSKKLVRSLFNNLDLITVRDEQSKIVLEELGINNVIVSADPALSLSLKHVNSPDLRFKGKVVISPVHRFTGEDKENYGKMHREFAIEMRKQYPDLKISLGLMFPQDSFMEKYLSDLDNFDQSYLLYKYHPNDIIEMFSHANCLISSRLHGVILSTIANTPTCPIVYDVKVLNFSKLIGIEDIASEFGDGITWTQKQDSGSTLFHNYQKCIAASSNQEKINKLITKSKHQANYLKKLV